MTYVGCCITCGRSVRWVGEGRGRDFRCQRKEISNRKALIMLVSYNVCSTRGNLEFESEIYKHLMTLSHVCFALSLSLSLLSLECIMFISRTCVAQALRLC